MLSPRLRMPLLIAVATVLVAGTVFAVSQFTAKAPPHVDSIWDSAAPSPSPRQSTSGADELEMALGTLIATTAVEELRVFDAPGGVVVHRLGPWSLATFQPLTMLGLEETTVDGARWLHVLVPTQPNQSTGWIREDDVTLTSSPVDIHIFVAERELELWEDGTLVLTAPVAVGTDETPTPPGVYSITDPLDSTHNDTGVYGAYALGLSGFSEVLETFNGAPPQLAIHGTNQPELIGQSVSNGCIRLSNADVLAVVDRVGLGTPVLIHASRSDLTSGVGD